MRGLNVARVLSCAWIPAACGSDGATTVLESSARAVTIAVVPSIDTLSALQDTVTFSIEVTGADASSVQWTSSDPRIATIDSHGLATAVSNGTTTIRASIAGVSATAPLTVEQQPVTLGLSLPSSATAEVGESIAIQWHGEDRNGFAIDTAMVETSSSNPAVATVEGSVANVIRDGQTSIGVTVGNTSTYVTLTATDAGAVPEVWAWTDFPRATLRGVWGSAPNDVWFTGWRGTMLHFDGVEVWDLTPPSAEETISDVWGSGPDDVWAVGEGGVILHHDGVGWSRHETIGVSYLSAVWGSGPDDVWVAGSGGVSAHYDGDSWQPSSAPIASFVTSLWGSGVDDVWAVGLGGQVLHLTDGDWRRVSGVPASGHLYGVWGTGPDNVYAVGVGGAVLHFNGAAWAVEAGGLTESTLSGVWGSGTDDIWVSGGRAMLHYDGSQWTRLATASSGWALWGFGPSDIWMAESSGNVRHFDGTSWVNRTPGVSETVVTRMWGADPNRLWATDHDGVLAFDGAEWTRVTLPTQAKDWNGVWGSGPADVWAVGSSVIAHHDGSAWAVSPVPDPSLHQLAGVWGSDPENVWAVGWPGTILRYDGVAWTDQSVAELREERLGFTDVWGTGADQVWAVGHRGHVWRWDGFAWTREAEGLTGRDLHAIWGSGPGDVWVAGGAQTVLHYDGQNWSDRTDELPYLLTCGVRCVWLYDVWGSAPDNVWMVGWSGGIVHYDGVRWTDYSRPLSSTTIYSLWGTAAGPLHMGLSSGGLLQGS